MSKKVAPTPSVAFTPGANDGPATARPSSSMLVNTRRALELFLDSTASEAICAQVVDEIVNKASLRHLSNHYDGVAVEYTAHAMWAEMLAVVGQSFVSLDAGMQRDPRPSKGEHIDASSAWKADEPPVRTATEEHSRRIMSIRHHYEPPPPVLDDDAASVGSLSKTQRTVPGPKPRALHRKNTQTFDAGLTTGSNGSRPTSGSSRRSSDEQQLQSHGSQHNVSAAATSVSRVGNAARKVLQNVNVIKGLGGTNRGLEATHTLAATSTGAGSQKNLKSTTLKRTNTSGQIAKGSGQAGGSDATPNVSKGLTSPRVPETLLQQEPSQAAEELEVIQHQQLIQRHQEAVEESARKAAKITKLLSDPKISAKPFVVDASGTVIPVLNMEHLQDGKQVPTVESPRYQLASNVPPAPVAPPPQPSKRGGPTRSAAEPSKAAAPVAAEAKKGASPKVKDEQFFTSDTTEIPMNINVQPVGGVGVKDGNGPPKKAELKVPQSKMLRSEYVKLVTAFDIASTAPPMNIDEHYSATVSLAKTAPASPAQEATARERGSRRGTDGLGEDRLGGTQGSQTARVPTVPNLKRAGQPSSARKPPSGHGGTNRAGSTSPTEHIGEASLHTQPPALPPQRPKLTDSRQRPHFHAKPTHDSTATKTALKTSTDWKETSVKRSSIGLTRVIVKHGIDEADEQDL